MSEINREQLYKLYWLDKLSIQEICNITNLSEPTIYKKLRQFNISIRKPLSRHTHITKELLQKTYNDSNNLEEVAKKLNTNRSWLADNMKKLGVKVRTNSENFERRRRLGISRQGRVSNQFLVKEGDLYIDKRENRVYVYTKNHPNFKIYVPRAHLVVEKNIGRYINKKEEIVHHINGIKDDDRLENLKLMKKKEHNKLHARVVGYV